MTPCQRMKIALEMSEEMRRVSLDGIRARHREMSGQEALELVTEICLPLV